MSVKKKTRDVAGCLVNVISLPALQKVVTLPSHRGAGQAFLFTTAVTHPQEKSKKFVCIGNSRALNKMKCDEFLTH